MEKWLPNALARVCVCGWKVSYVVSVVLTNPLGCMIIAQFRQTNFGLVVDILDETFSNPYYGARRGDAKQLIFLVTDGSMDVQKSKIYTANRCPLPGSSYLCGADAFNWRGMPEPVYNKCTACWRNHMAERLKTIPVSEQRRLAATHVAHDGHFKPVHVVLLINGVGCPSARANPVRFDLLVVCVRSLRTPR